MQYKLKDISKGDKITVEETIKGVVDSVEKDIKNGMPGVAYTSDEKEKKFCYLTQITNIEKITKEVKVKKSEATSVVIKRPKLKDIAIGDKVVVASYDEGDREGVVNDVLENIKNDMPGVDYTAKDGESYWCYLDQVKSVEKKATNSSVKAKKAKP